MKIVPEFVEGFIAVNGYPYLNPINGVSVLLLLPSPVVLMFVIPVNRACDRRCAEQADDGFGENVHVWQSSCLRLRESYPL